jgi:hypothetical protein
MKRNSINVCDFLTLDMCQWRSLWLLAPQDKILSTSLHMDGANETWESRCKLLGSDDIVYVFVFLSSIIICRSYKLTLSDRAQVALQLTVTFADLVQIFLAGPPLLWDPRIPPPPRRHFQRPLHMRKKNLKHFPKMHVVLHLCMFENVPLLTWWSDEEYKH